ncbi:long-chain-fatty-acid--CoA ligase [Achromobacter sp. GG226]|uniref:long-chain-fatty-acid--CoA ligase n=1 Tax=Verticiella alkaliphila TaxID=2779529 RepID=UPI001C0C80EC|nr:long-chain-fatty-acid--CoA ligase [Verticiella sp. GG226]MBU4610664.1 long-chain-fatty-acid--CoA ligase [Verticiella sp. GG226]
MDDRAYPEFSSRYPLLLTTLMKRPVALYPEQIGVVYRHHQTGHYTRLTWRQWHERVCRLANALTGPLGVRPGAPPALGDRVGTMAFNTHRHLELYYAVPGVGATLHAINIRLSPEHVAYTIRHAQDHTLFVDDTALPLLDAIWDKVSDVVRQVVVMSDDPGLPASRIPGLIAYEDLIAAESAEHAWAYLDENTNATLCYTTGTTGLPKGAVFTHRQLYLMALHSLAAQSMSNTPAHSTQERLGENTVPLLNTPLFHAHGWGAPFTSVFCAQKVVLPGTFTVQGFCELVQTEKVTSVGVVPTIAAMLVAYPELHRYDLSSLTRVGVGGGALPLGLKAKLEKLLPSFQVSSGYGMTETAPVAITAFVKKHMVDWGKARVDEMMVKTGIPIPGLEVQVVDESGRPVARDGQSIGEIVMRGPWVTERYYENAEKTAEVWHDGWFHTGDIATVDSEGIIVIADRIKDVIRSGAEMVPTVLLENLIAMADFVLEATVVGVPDPIWGERPLALVQIRQGFDATEADVVDFLVEHGVRTGKITAWMVPRLVALVDQIPRTSVGKFDKKAVRERIDEFVALAREVPPREAADAPAAIRS